MADGRGGPGGSEDDGSQRKVGCAWKEVGTEVFRPGKRFPLKARRGLSMTGC